MDYPYKYLVIVSNEDSYSCFEQVYKFNDIADAIKRVESAEECGDNVCLYRINKHSGFKK